MWDMKWTSTNAAYYHEDSYLQPLLSSIESSWTTLRATTATSFRHHNSLYFASSPRRRGLFIEYILIPGGLAMHIRRRLTLAFAAVIMIHSSTFALTASLHGHRDQKALDYSTSVMLGLFVVVE